MYKPVRKFMKVAIEEAIKNNKKLGEAPIGAVIVKGNKIIGKSGQRRATDKEPSAHAEIIAMRKASKKLNSKYLKDCVLYSTNEPCCMCTGAAIWGRMKGIVFGASMKDMEEYWVKERGINKSEWWMVHVSCEDILKRLKPKNSMFLIKNFMRKECKNLFKLNN